MPGDKSGEDGLYKLSSDCSTISSITTLGDPIGSKLDLFEVNKDGTKVLVPGSHGEITLLDLGTRAVATVEEKGTEDLKFAPQWRTFDEFSYPHRVSQKTANGHDVEVVLRGPTTAGQSISAGWPTQFSLLTDPKKSTK